jgi:hypothetical protein
VARAQARAADLTGADRVVVEVLVVVLEHSAAVALDEERAAAAASQCSGVTPSVVEDIYYIDVVSRLYCYHHYTDLSSKVFLAYSRRLAGRELSIPSAKV